MIRATLPCTTRALLLAVVSLFCGAAAAQPVEAAMLKRAADLRDAPAETGRSLAALPAQEALTRLGERQGAWIRVQITGGLAGWVHMFDVGPSGMASGAGTSVPASSNPVTSSLRGLSNLLSGGSSPPPRVATSTIGIRGLEAEDLARAQPNMNAVGQMERLRQGESEARQFAADAALVAATVPALPAPARAGNTNNRQQP